MAEKNPGNPDDPTGGGTRPGDEGDQDWARTRYRTQVDQMRNAIESDPRNNERGIKLRSYPDTDDPADTAFLYRIDTILVRDADAREARAVLGLEPPDPAQPRDPTLPPPIRGLTVLRVPDAADAVRRVNAVLGHGVATLDRVLHLTSSSACPATEPFPASGRPAPPRTRHKNLGRGVKVAVIDTGLPASNDQVIEPTQPWLRGVTGGPEDAALVGHYGGHGLFVAGVLRTMAPRAEVFVHPFLFTSGGVIESDLAPQLVEALRTGPDIISMSAGLDLSPESATAVDRQGLLTADALHALISLEAFEEEYLRCSPTLLVCAAGNNGNRGPFVPASRCWTVAVGALDADGRLADYSNRGPWVDVYARGSDLVNAYPDGSYTYTETEGFVGWTTRFTHGMARWSGTSFSTPLVAGLVAARLSWSGESPAQAWDALSRIARARARRGRPVLEPGDADPGVQPPATP